MDCVLEFCTEYNHSSRLFNIIKMMTISTQFLQIYQLFKKYKFDLTECQIAVVWSFKFIIFLEYLNL